MKSVKLVDEFDYHDFHLRSYTVGDFGHSIAFDLVSGFEPKRATQLEFSEVVAYRFVHTGGSIITYILEVSFLDGVREMTTDFARDFKHYGGISVALEDNEAYGAYFEREGYRTWIIHSAIGFLGMIVARNITNKKEG